MLQNAVNKDLLWTIPEVSCLWMQFSWQHKGIHPTYVSPKIQTKIFHKYMVSCYRLRNWQVEASNKRKVGQRVWLVEVTALSRDRALSNLHQRVEIYLACVGLILRNLILRCLYRNTVHTSTCCHAIITDFPKMSR